MTAIFGTIRWDEQSPRTDLARLARSLVPYGGDGTDDWASDQVALGRCLKLLLPEDAHDRQPVRSEGSRYVVVADARLTERDDLVRQLGLEAAAAARMSDAAVIAAAIERWHEDAFDRIYGVFAAAAWDTHEPRLILARDHLGERPLFFHQAADRLAFASMPLGLLALPDVAQAPDADAMRRFMRLLPPSGSASFFAGIERVIPGHVAIVRDGAVVQRRYWDPDTTPLRLASHAAYQAAFARHFEAAVQASLRGAGPRVAAHLSSGFDSSAVATTAARLGAADGLSVVAFTAVPRDGFDARDAAHVLSDEGHVAAETAALHANIEHVRVPTDRTFVDSLADDPVLAGLPALNICNKGWVDAINAACRRRGLTVLLVGDRGNGTISEDGTIALAELAWRGRGIAWLRIARGLVRSGAMRWRHLAWRAVAPVLPAPAWRRLDRLRTGKAKRPVAEYSPLRAGEWAAASAAERRAAATAHPLERSWNAEEDREQASSLTDRMFMLRRDHGPSLKGSLATGRVDVRDPTSDRRLVEFSLRVPVEQLIWRGQPRSLLRPLLAGRVSPTVLAGRTGNQGADWFEGVSARRDELALEVERIADFAPSAALIDVDRLRAIAASLPEEGSDAWYDKATIADVRLCLLRGVSAAHFMRKAAGSNL